MATETAELSRAMSYANVAASEGLPASQQPRPDPNLLERGGTDSGVADDTAKVNIVPSDFKAHPQTTTSLADILPDDEKSSKATKPHSTRRSKVNKEAESTLALAKYYLLQPGVAGGLIGLGLSRLTL